MTQPSSSYFQLLKTYLGPQGKRVTLLALLVFLSIGLQLANPQLIRYYLDTLETGGTFQQLIGAATLFMGVTIITQIIRLAATYFSEIIGWTATNWLRADLARHCLGLDMSFHKVHTPGELIERVDGDVNELAEFFSHMILTIIGNGLLFLGVLIILWLEGWQIGLTVTAVALVTITVVNILRKRITPRWEALRATEADLFGFIEERLSGTDDIQTSGAKAYTMNGLYRLLDKRWLAAKHALQLDAWIIPMPIWTFGIAYAAAHLVTGYLYQSSGLTIGGVYLIFHYISMIEGPMWQTMDMVDKFQRAAAAMNRVNKLFQIQPTLIDGPGVDLPQGPLAVAFAGVSFQYEDMDGDQLAVESSQLAVESSQLAVDGSQLAVNGSSNGRMNRAADETDNEIPDDVLTRADVVIQDVSFRLEPGKILGLLGRTGSGKSTLSKLLFRFYDPTVGAIQLGSNGEMVDLRQAKRADLRGRIGMVTQDVQLFHATVRENLALFDPTIPDEQILDIIEDVGLTDWLNELPNGLDSRLSGDDSNLSAGEAQLLAFTRVFLADPGLVILDEASSRLDPATEERIEAALDRLLADRTGIIIAHRLATVQRADEILILDQGSIAEYGQRETLANDPNSRFYELLQTGLEEVL